MNTVATSPVAEAQDTVEFVIVWYGDSMGDYDDQDRYCGPSVEFRMGTREDFEDARDNIDEGHVMLKADYERREFESEASSLEPKMAQIMRDHKLSTPFCGEFIAVVMKKVQEIQDNWQGQLDGMEEDGLCGGWGMTAEQYFNDRDYIQGRMMKEVAEADILDAMERHFPLRYAKAMEEYRALSEEAR